MSKVAIFPKLKVFPFDEEKKQISLKEIDQISAHYTTQVFNGLKNQNLAFDTDFMQFMVVKEFVNSIILKNYNTYHPFSEILENILLAEVGEEPSNDDTPTPPAEITQEKEPTKKRGRKPKPKA